MLEGEGSLVGGPSRVSATAAAVKNSCHCCRQESLSPPRGGSAAAEKSIDSAAAAGGCVAAEVAGSYRQPLSALKTKEENGKFSRCVFFG